jgi:uncharacterized protein (TIGR00725 family)
MADSPLIVHAGKITRSGQHLNAALWRWQAGTAVKDSGAPLTPRAALTQISGGMELRHLVIGVIGPRDATQAQMEAAETVGVALGRLGITVICGGKSGVMEAVSKGCHAAGGLAIGILPGDEPGDANPYIGIPLPTGLSEGRNMVIAKSARVLIAVGGSYGTLSEVAYGLHFSRPVIGVEGAADVEGMMQAASAEEAVDMACAALLNAALPAEKT